MCHTKRMTSHRNFRHPVQPVQQQDREDTRSLVKHFSLCACVALAFFYSWTLSAILALAFYLYYYFAFAVTTPEVAVQEGSPLELFLWRHMPSLREDYWPALYCLEARGQMLLSLMIRALIPEPPFRRELLQMRDGGEIGLDWLDYKERDSKEDSAYYHLSQLSCYIMRSVYISRIASFLPSQFHTLFYPTPVPTATPCNTARPSSGTLNSDTNGKTPLVVLLLPGITGDSQGGYMRALAYESLGQGAHVAVFNFRGLGGVPLKTPRTFCATNPDDLSEVVDHIHELHPGCHLVVVGISMGAMIVGHYLISLGEGARKKVSAAMLVSPAWDVPLGIVNMQSSLINRRFLDHVTSNFREVVIRDRAALEGQGPWNVEDIIRTSSVFEVDHMLTAPQFGYSSADEYYKATSLGAHNLVKIRVPVLAVSAADDPLQPYQGIPVDVARSSEHMAIAVTQRGGHVAFLEGAWPRRRNYMERLVAEFVGAVGKYRHELALVGVNGSEAVMERVSSSVHAAKSNDSTLRETLMNGKAENNSRRRIKQRVRT